MHISAEDQPNLQQAAVALKALADAGRLRVAALLANGGELCVCEIVDVLGLPQYAVSRQLGVLRAAGLVEDRRSGQWVYYSLSSQTDPFLRALSAALHGVTAPADAESLRSRLALRREGICVVGYDGSDCRGAS